MGIPDQDIHPRATGLAAETVAAHEQENELVFWSG
jgi:glutathione S-transferase